MHLLQKIRAGVGRIEKRRDKGCRINIDENKELASKYGVRAVPTIYYIKDGEIVDKTLGYNPEEIKEKAKNLKQ